MKSTIKMLMIAIVVIVSAKFNAALGQATLGGTNTYPGSGSPYIGWDNTSNYQLDIAQYNTTTPYPINFWTSGNKHATLDVSGNYSIGLHSLTNAYQIADTAILWHNGNHDNLFVGIGAGNTGIGWYYPFPDSHWDKGQTTLVGYYAGNQLNFIDGKNTFIGYNTGSAATADLSWTSAAYNNTAVGAWALQNTHAYGACVLGFNAARNNLYGCSMVAIGEQAAFTNSDGNDNTAIGESALYSNTSLSDNVAIGEGALYFQAYDPDHSGFCSNPNYGCVSSYNVAVGNNSLYSNAPSDTSNGIDLTSVGNFSLYSNTTGKHNTASGYSAGYSNRGGDDNAIFGYEAGYGASGNSYSRNDFFGSQAGFSTHTGIDNVCIGNEAGYSNLYSYKTFVGHMAGYYTTGDYNTFIGYIAGTANTTGISNTFMGLDAGYANTTGSQNSGLGLQVLGQTTTGGSNTGIGYKAGYTNTTGTQNTFVGYGADAGANNLTDAAAFGYNAIVSTPNEMWFGDANVTYIRSTTGWWTSSDGRFKTNVQENVKGLEFITKLRPVTYNLDTKKLNDFLRPNQNQSADSLGNTVTDNADFTASTSIVHSGFIAQEVETASQACGYTSSIVRAPANSNDPYALNYAEIVVPLVKAVQQLDSLHGVDSLNNANLQHQSDSINTVLAQQQTTNQSLQNSLDSLGNLMNQMQQLINSCCQANGGGDRKVNPNSGGNDGGNGNSNGMQAINLQLDNSSAAALFLSEPHPNPFSGSTTISFTIPDNEQGTIIFYDALGRVLQQQMVSGTGQINVDASNLQSGIYSYTLTAGGQMITKKMVKQQ